MTKIVDYGMNYNEIIIYRVLPYQPKKKTSLSAYGGSGINAICKSIGK